MGHIRKQSGAGVFCTIALSSVLLCTVANPAFAGVKDNVAYVGIAGTQFEYKNLPGGNVADNKANGVTFALGTYITDYVRAELRAGFGPDDAALAPDLTGGIKRFYSGYFGAEYPVTDYMAIYAMFGVTHVVATTERADPGTFPKILNELVDSSFSPSFLLGGSVRIYKKFHGFLDYGRLHADSLTGIDVKDLNLGVKSEF